MYKHEPARRSCSECGMYGSKDEFEYAGHPCEEPERTGAAWEVLRAPWDSDPVTISTGDSSTVQEGIEEARRVIADAINAQADEERKTILSIHRAAKAATAGTPSLEDIIESDGDLIKEWWHIDMDAALNRHVTAGDIAETEEMYYHNPLRLRAEVNWATGWVWEYHVKKPFSKT